MGRHDVYTDGLRDSDDPSIAYRARRRLDGLPEWDVRQLGLRARVATTPNVQRLLSRRDSDGRIRLGNEYHCYRKFQGAHWTLAALAELGYPPGDPTLMPLVDQVHEWLRSRQHLRPPSTQVIPGQADRVRRCASQEGLAIWYFHELGLADRRVDDLVSRLVELQWPDGGWNCDKDPAARTSSVQETLLPLRGLARHVAAGSEERRATRELTAARAATTSPAPGVSEAVDAATEFLLQRRLLWRRHDGAVLRPAWGPDPMLIQWPIRFYDVLSVLVVMTELGRIADPRCVDATRVLAGKRLPSGGFPAEARTARTVSSVVTRGTFAEWGPSGRSRPNPFVSIDAAWVLDRADAAHTIQRAGTGQARPGTPERSGTMAPWRSR